MPVHLNAELHCTTAIGEAKSMRCLVGYKWEATGLIQAGHRRLCLFIIQTFDICYVSVILKLDSEPVISFLIEANPFSGVCFFAFL
jgi:hypothetical protein